ncbi:MAG TPA: anti-sigma factor [Gemmatimonadales bacterium]|nr:anti-sigma factor [Gemmatimonadales bacterium]
MSTPDELALQDLAPAYVLGALSRHEAERFEAYLARSPQAQREVAELREAAALLAASARPAEPMAGELRDRVLAAIAAQGRSGGAARAGEGAGAALAASAPGGAPRATRMSGVRPLVWALLAASVVAAVGFALQSQSLARRLAASDSLVIQQRDTVARLTQALEQQSQRLQRLEGTLASIFAPGTELVQLTANGRLEPRIQLFWDRRRNLAVLHATKLSAPPQGRTYQLWFIQNGKPVPSVTFDVEQGGEATVPQVTVPADGPISAAAVTEEPVGGSQQPTSPPLLAGAIPKT